MVEGHSIFPLLITERPPVGIVRGQKGHCMRNWEEFVLSVMGNADTTPGHMETAEAAEIMEWFGSDCPHGLTPERFAEIWNYYVQLQEGE